MIPTSCRFWALQGSASSPLSAPGSFKTDKNGPRLICSSERQRLHQMESSKDVRSTSIVIASRKPKTNTRFLVEQYEQNLPTDYLQFNNSPLKPRPYSLLNSNCQHFILDLAFCLQVEFDAHGLAEVWRGTTIVKRVLAPTMGLLGFVLSALAFLAESKWAKITSYTVSGLYYIVFKVVLVQDLTTSTERQTLLHALHFYDIDHRSEYLCRQFRKLRYRIRSTDHDFYPETEISLYGSRMLYAFFLAYYIYTGSAPRTLGFLFLALLVSCVTNDITDYLLLVWHPLAEERRAVNKRLDKARRSLLRNWRHLRWPDLLYTLNTTDKRPPTSGLERMELHIEQTRLGQRGVEAGLLGDRDDEQVIIHCDKPPPHSIRCLFKCGFDCTLGSRARSKAEKYWRDRDLPIGEKWEADLL